MFMFILPKQFWVTTGVTVQRLFGLIIRRLQNRAANSTPKLGGVGYDNHHIRGKVG